MVEVQHFFRIIKQINQNRSQIYAKIYQKSSKMGSEIYEHRAMRASCPSWLQLDGSGAHLGPILGGLGTILEPFWGPSWSQGSAQIAPGSYLKRYQFYHRFEGRFLKRSGADLTPSWAPKSFPNGSKLAPNWLQVGTNLGQDWTEWVQVGPS